MILFGPKRPIPDDYDDDWSQDEEYLKQQLYNIVTVSEGATTNCTQILRSKRMVPLVLLMVRSI